MGAAEAIAALVPLPLLGVGCGLAARRIARPWKAHLLFAVLAAALFAAEFTLLFPRLPPGEDPLPGDGLLLVMFLAYSALVVGLYAVAWAVTTLVRRLSTAPAPSD